MTTTKKLATTLRMSDVRSTIEALGGRIRRDRDGDLVVKFGGATYYTSDLADALDTARDMAKRHSGDEALRLAVVAMRDAQVKALAAVLADPHFLGITTLDTVHTLTTPFQRHELARGGALTDLRAVRDEVASLTSCYTDKEAARHQLVLLLGAMNETIDAAVAVMVAQEATR